MNTTSLHGSAALGMVVLRPALHCTKGTVSAPHEADAAEDLVGAHDNVGVVGRKPSEEVLCGLLDLSRLFGWLAGLVLALALYRTT